MRGAEELSVMEKGDLLDEWTQRRERTRSTDEDVLGHGENPERVTDAAG